MDLDDPARPVCVYCALGFCTDCLGGTRPGGCACRTCHPSEERR